jgi:hypothetical protein
MSAGKIIDRSSPLQETPWAQSRHRVDLVAKSLVVAHPISDNVHNHNSETKRLEIVLKFETAVNREKGFAPTLKALQERVVRKSSATQVAYCDNIVACGVEKLPNARVHALVKHDSHEIIWRRQIRVAALERAQAVRSLAGAERLGNRTKRRRGCRLPQRSREGFQPVPAYP